MKGCFVLVFVLLLTIVSGQEGSAEQKVNSLAPNIWLGLWDKTNSTTSFEYDTISYDEIPKYLDFRGTVVEAVKWKDSASEKILVQSLTGTFLWKDYNKDSTAYDRQDKSELYVYLFEKRQSAKQFSRVWRVYDYTECFGVDMHTGFITRATTITDVDNNGISEVSIPYTLTCRGDVSPATMKIIMYEGMNKYALRGNTKTMCGSSMEFGGEFQPSSNLKNKPLFKAFLQKRWNLHKCE